MQLILEVKFPKGSKINQREEVRIALSLAGFRLLRVTSWMAVFTSTPNATRERAEAVLNMAQGLYVRSWTWQKSQRTGAA